MCGTLSSFNAVMILVEGIFSMQCAYLPMCLLNGGNNLHPL